MWVPWVFHKHLPYALYEVRFKYHLVVINKVDIDSTFPTNPCVPVTELVSNCFHKPYFKY